MSAEHKKLMACCPSCGAPLISTLAFSKAEFYCLECGGRFGFLEPHVETLTPELSARHGTLRDEWLEHAGAKLLSRGSWHVDCEECAERSMTNPHVAHATDEEVAAHEAAVVWLRDRVTA